ncbi:MAG: papain fold toxin domain-containing protein, partial [Cyanobacteria bacterium J06632_19]
MQQIEIIASRYGNLECVKCAEAIKNYLILQKITGKQIKLYTGSATGRDSYIYDD